MSWLQKTFPTFARWLPAKKKKTEIPAEKKNSPEFERLTDLFSHLEQREIRPRIPSSLREKTALHLSAFPGLMTPVFLEKGASLIIHLSPRPFRNAPTEPKTFSIQGSPQNMPLKSTTVDFMILSLSNLSKDKTPLLVRESGRLLKDGGKLILSHWHPFLGQRLREKFGPKESGDEEKMNFEKYFKLFRQEGLSIGNLKEIFLDGSLRSFFKTEEEKHFFNLDRGAPLAIFFFLSKIKKKGSPNGT
ncbi:MAG: hypothetical protein Q7S00_02530 [bacterium]|nr:hypothetical protein [bacterium]